MALGTVLRSTVSYGEHSDVSAILFGVVSYQASRDTFQVISLASSAHSKQQPTFAGGVVQLARILIYQRDTPTAELPFLRSIVHIHTCDINVTFGWIQKYSMRKP